MGRESRGRRGPTAGVGDGGRTRLTRRGRIVVWAGGILAVALIGVSGTAAWIYQDLNGNIHSADIDNKIGGGSTGQSEPGVQEHPRRGLRLA